jgi:hypothetical protein
MHTDFSTNLMRNSETSKSAIGEAIKKLEKKHTEHISVCGYSLAERLTGQHEIFQYAYIFLWG